RILSPLRLPIPPSRLSPASSGLEEASIIADCNAVDKRDEQSLAARAGPHQTLPNTQTECPRHPC
ncbi:MAG TPA: hypothetical protein PKA23_12735, partial [Accumulibacter sp.]|uniref:hypothetical protein n=1 Tax=Accumulibacter sp. TaxID=2053492 RepID=UPI002B5EC765